MITMGIIVDSAEFVMKDHTNNIIDAKIAGNVI